MKPKILERETVYTGYLTLERLHVRLADGAQVWLEVEGHGEAVVVLPYDAERHCALVVRLFRAPVFDTTGEDVLEEACAGMIGNEDAETAARREAFEELGVVLHLWSSLVDSGRVPASRLQRHSLFLAPYRAADRVGPGGGVADEREGITVVERSFAQLAADVDHGRIADGKLVTLVLALRLRRPQLFD